MLDHDRYFEGLDGKDRIFWASSYVMASTLSIVLFRLGRSTLVVDSQRVNSSGLSIASAPARYAQPTTNFTVILSNYIILQLVCILSSCSLLALFPKSLLSKHAPVGMVDDPAQHTSTRAPAEINLPRHRVSIISAVCSLRRPPRRRRVYEAQSIPQVSALAGALPLTEQAPPRGTSQIISLQPGLRNEK